MIYFKLIAAIECMLPFWVLVMAGILPWQIVAGVNLILFGAIVLWGREDDDEWV